MKIKFSRKNTWEIFTVMSFLLSISHFIRSVRGESVE